ncbi:uncharacterized protein LOC143294553 [Babylonia areolata]|uniref:uncharacterized protein LOC143294553 n=1 Tax=Babylonia areolata TaxID=304850 RepID=UPI003FD61368
MGAVAQILAGLVVFSVTSTCLCASKAKDKCPGDSLAVIVAQQNKFIQELMTEQVEIELQMTKLRNYMEEIISDLNNQLEECKKEENTIRAEIYQAGKRFLGDDGGSKEQRKDSLEKVIKSWTK